MTYSIYTMAIYLCVSLLLLVKSNAFSILPTRTNSPSATMSSLYMGLFDGVKDAFSAPALERSTLDAERETPIDRWMGWSVSKDNQQQQASAKALPSDYVDSMDTNNYITVHLPKPMGIIFEENDEKYGGIFVQSLKEDSIAATISPVVKPGDQLVAVNAIQVHGKAFDNALNAIVEATGETTRLVLFRGTAKQFYGPTGPSQAWLQEFLTTM